MHTMPPIRKPASWQQALALLLSLTLVLGPTGSAWAQSKGQPTAKRVLVLRTQFSPDVPSNVAPRVLGYFDTILGMDERFEVIPYNALGAANVKPVEVAPVAGSEAALKLEQAKAATEEGKALHKKKRYGDAVKAFERALEFYAQAAGQLSDISGYVAALSGRAYAYFADGYDDNGEGDLARVLAIQPSFQVDSAAPKRAQQVIERVRARLRPAGFTLKVSANANNATVYVNGTNRGGAPLTLSDLPAGEHIVRVLANDYEPFGQVVSLVEANAEVNAHLALQPGKKAAPVTTTHASSEDPTGLEHAAATGDFGPAFTVQASQLARTNRLDAVLMTFVRKKEIGYELGTYVWHVNGRIAEADIRDLNADLTGLQVAVMGALDKARPFLNDITVSQSLIGRGTVYRAAAQPESQTLAGGRPDTVLRNPNQGNLDIAMPSTTDSKSPAVTETWWFWTLIGVVVVGGGVGAYMLMNNDSEAGGGFNTSVTW